MALLLLSLMLLSFATVAYKAGNNPAFKQRLLAHITGIEKLPSDRVVFQHTRVDCGPAALKMVLDFYSIPVTLAQLDADLGPGSQGTSMLGMKKVAIQYGLQATGWTLSLTDLDRIPLPAIAVVNGNHYAVVERKQPDGVILADPARGRLRVSNWRFRLQWKGETLVLWKNSLPDKLRWVEESAAKSADGFVAEYSRALTVR